MTTLAPPSSIDALPKRPWDSAQPQFDTAESSATTLVPDISPFSSLSNPPLVSQDTGDEVQVSLLIPVHTDPFHRELEMPTLSSNGSSQPMSHSQTLVLPSSLSGRLLAHSSGEMNQNTSPTGGDFIAPGPELLSNSSLAEVLSSVSSTPGRVKVDCERGPGDQAHPVRAVFSSIGVLRHRQDSRCSPEESLQRDQKKHVTWTFFSSHQQHHSPPTSTFPVLPHTDTNTSNDAAAVVKEGGNPSPDRCLASPTSVAQESAPESSASMAPDREGKPAEQWYLHAESTVQNGNPSPEDGVSPDEGSALTPQHLAQLNDSFTDGLLTTKTQTTTHHTPHEPHGYRTERCSSAPHDLLIHASSPPTHSKNELDRGSPVPPNNTETSTTAAAGERPVPFHETALSASPPALQQSVGSPSGSDRTQSSLFTAPNSTPSDQGSTTSNGLNTFPNMQLHGVVGSSMGRWKSSTTAGMPPLQAKRPFSQDSPPQNALDWERIMNAGGNALAHHTLSDGRHVSIKESENSPSTTEATGVATASNTAASPTRKEEKEEEDDSTDLVSFAPVFCFVEDSKEVIDTRATANNLSCLSGSPATPQSRHARADYACSPSSLTAKKSAVNLLKLASGSSAQSKSRNHYGSTTTAVGSPSSCASGNVGTPGSSGGAAAAANASVGTAITASFTRHAANVTRQSTALFGIPSSTAGSSAGWNSPSSESPSATTKVTPTTGVAPKFTAQGSVAFSASGIAVGISPGTAHLHSGSQQDLIHSPSSVLNHESRPPSVPSVSSTVYSIASGQRQSPPPSNTGRGVMAFPGPGCTFPHPVDSPRTTLESPFDSPTTSAATIPVSLAAAPSLLALQAAPSNAGSLAGLSAVSNGTSRSLHPATAPSHVSERLTEIIGQLPASQQAAALIFLEGLLSDAAKESAYSSAVEPVNSAESSTDPSNTLLNAADDSNAEPSTGAGGLKEQSSGGKRDLVGATLPSLLSNISEFLPPPVPVSTPVDGSGFQPRFISPAVEAFVQDALSQSVLRNINVGPDNFNSPPFSHPVSSLTAAAAPGVTAHHSRAHRHSSSASQATTTNTSPFQADVDRSKVFPVLPTTTPVAVSYSPATTDVAVSPMPHTVGVVGKESRGAATLSPVDLHVARPAAAPPQVTGRVVTGPFDAAARTSRIPTPLPAPHHSCGTGKSTRPMQASRPQRWNATSGGRAADKGSEFTSPLHQGGTPHPHPDPHTHSTGVTSESHRSSSTWMGSGENSSVFHHSNHHTLNKRYYPSPAQSTVQSVTPSGVSSPFSPPTSPVNRGVRHSKMPSPVDNAVHNTEFLATPSSQLNRAAQRNTPSNHKISGVNSSLQGSRAFLSGGLGEHRRVMDRSSDSIQSKSFGSQHWHTRSRDRLNGSHVVTPLYSSRPSTTGRESMKSEPSINLSLSSPHSLRKAPVEKRPVSSSSTCSSEDTNEVAAVTSSSALPPSSPTTVSESLRKDDPRVLEAEQAELRYLVLHYEPFFHLSVFQLEGIMQRFTRHVYTKNSLVVEEGGDPLHSLILLMSGRLSFESGGKSYGAMTHRLFYGEMEMSYELERSNMAMRVVSDTAVVYSLPQEEYRSLVIDERRARDRDVTNFVNQIPLFQVVPLHTRLLLVKAFSITRVEEKTQLSTRGKFVDTMYLIINGKVQLRGRKFTSNKASGSLSSCKSSPLWRHPKQHQPSGFCLPSMLPPSPNSSSEGAPEELVIEKGPGEMICEPDFIFKSEAVFDVIALTSLQVAKVSWLQFETTVLHTAIHSLKYFISTDPSYVYYQNYSTPEMLHEMTHVTHRQRAMETAHSHPRSRRHRMSSSACDSLLLAGGTASPTVPEESARATLLTEAAAGMIESLSSTSTSFSESSCGSSERGGSTDGPEKSLRNRTRPSSKSFAPLFKPGNAGKAGMASNSASMSPLHLLHRHSVGPTSTRTHHSHHHHHHHHNAGPVELAGGPISNLGEIIFSGSKNLYRFHADSLDTNGTTLVGVIVDGTIIRWNSVMKRITGFTPSEVIGQSIYSLLSNEESRQRMRSSLQLSMQYSGAWEQYVKEELSHQSVFSFRQHTGLYAVGIAFCVVPSVCEGTAQVLLLIGRAAQMRSASHYADDVTRWLQSSLAPQLRVCQDCLQVMDKRKWVVTQDEAVRLHAAIDICGYMVQQFIRFSKLNQESFNQALRPLRLPALMRYITKEAWSLVKQTNHSFTSNFDSIPQLEVFMEPQKVVEALKGILLDVLRCAQENVINVALLITIVEPENQPEADMDVYEGPQPSMRESMGSSNMSGNPTPTGHQHLLPPSSTRPLHSPCTTDVVQGNSHLSTDRLTSPTSRQNEVFNAMVPPSLHSSLNPSDMDAGLKSSGPSGTAASPQYSPSSPCAPCAPPQLNVPSMPTHMSGPLVSLVPSSPTAPFSPSRSLPVMASSMAGRPSLGLTSPILYHAMMGNLESLCGVRRIRFEMRDSGTPMMDARTTATAPSSTTGCNANAQNSEAFGSPMQSPNRVSSPNFPTYKRGQDLKKITPLISELGGMLYGFYSAALGSNVMRIELPLLLAPGKSAGGGADEDDVEMDEQGQAPVGGGTHTVIVADNNRVQTNTLCQILWARQHAVVPVSSYSELMRQMDNSVGNILMIDPINLTITPQELEQLRGYNPFDTIIDKAFGMVVVVMVTDWGDWRVQKLLSVKNVIKLPKTGASAQIHIAIQVAEKQAAEIQEERERFEIIRRTFTSAVPNRHKVVKLLGKGSFGDVFEVEDTLTGGRMAMKEMRLSNNVDADSVLQELLAMTALQHENIIRYFFCEKANNSLLQLYMEIAAGGTLKDKVRGLRKGLELKDTVRYMRDVCCGLAYIHTQRYVHRDLKPANLLLDKEDRVKIGDFGTAKKIKPHEQLYRLVGTPQYIAPEVFSANVAEMNGYSFKVDVWSIGCVALELVTGQPPFSHLEQAQGVGIMKYLTELSAAPDITPLETHHRILYDFVKQCLQFDPTMRPTADQLVEHELFHFNFEEEARQNVGRQDGEAIERSNSPVENNVVVMVNHDNRGDHTTACNSSVADMSDGNAPLPKGLNATASPSPAASLKMPVHTSAHHRLLYKGDAENQSSDSLHRNSAMHFFELPEINKEPQTTHSSGDPDSVSSGLHSSYPGSSCQPVATVLSDDAAASPHHSPFGSRSAEATSHHASAPPTDRLRSPPSSGPPQTAASPLPAPGMKWKEEEFFSSDSSDE